MRLVAATPILVSVYFVVASTVDAVNVAHFQQQQPQHKVISTTKAPAGPGGAAQGLLDSTGFLSTSLQYGVPPSSNATTTSSVTSSAKAQMEQAMRNIQEVFIAAGYNLTTDANNCWLYGFNADTFGEISTVYNTFFPTLNHPARNPIGAGLVVVPPLSSSGSSGFKGEKSTETTHLGFTPEIAVRCTGYPNGGLRVRPQNFFLSDFNAQAMVSGGSSIVAAAQLGMDPVNGTVVGDGSLRKQTLQALSNIATVFSDVMPELDRTGNTISTASTGALRQRGVDCQIIVNESLWDSKSNQEVIQGAVDQILGLSGEGEAARPIVNYRSQPSNTLPLVAGVAVTCSGDTALVQRNRLIRGSDNFTLGIVSQYSIPGREETTSGSSSETVVKKITVVPLLGVSSDRNDYMWSDLSDAFSLGLDSTTSFQSAATFCEIIAKTDEAARLAVEQFTSKFWSSFKPTPLVATVARFRGDDKHDFSIQCSGMTAKAY